MRSRYSAAMSSRPGAANHSRERNGRTGLRSDMQNSLGEARNVDFEAEQRACEWLCLALFVAQVMASRRDIGGAQVGPAECKFGDVGTGKAHRANQFATRCVAAH